VEVKRQDIVEAARKALGWPFVHRGRKGKDGIDCIGILFHIANETGLIKNMNIPDYYHNLKYSRHPAMSGPDAAWMLRELSLSFERKPKTNLKKGDIVYCRNDKWVHVGIVTPKTMIHAYAFPHMKVIEHVYDRKWKTSTVAAFHWPGAI
jgi:cell wall-associated NlpC family hydrolase